LLSEVQISASSIVKGRSLLSAVANGSGERFVIFLLDAGAPIDGLSRHNLMNLVQSVAVFNRLVARGVNLTAMRDNRGATIVPLCGPQRHP
jgi:hypothetical protein